MAVRLAVALVVGLACFPSQSPADLGDRHVSHILSKDGTDIAVECGGSGPELLIVHGGTGDRKRWTPLFPYLEHDFTVCAMDRRAHGQSGDGASYTLAREVEDVAAVAESRGSPVAVLGHSFGGVIAYEAAFLSPRITRLLLYEPPISNADHASVLAEMDGLIAAGHRDTAAVTFMRDIVHLSAGEIAAMRARPAWAMIVASVGLSIRQDRALSAYRYNPVAARTLRKPTLLLMGERTASPELRSSMQQLARNLPSRQLVVLRGQEHNAMDTDRDGLAGAIKTFMRATADQAVPPPGTG